MNYKQRNIILLPFPFSDLSASKKRPALILSNNKFNKSSNDLICCLITTNLKPDRLAIEIDEKDVEEGKIHYKSRVKPYRIFTTDKRIVVKKLCSLKKQKFKETINKLIETIKAS